MKIFIFIECEWKISWGSLDTASATADQAGQAHLWVWCPRWSGWIKRAHFHSSISGCVCCLALRLLRRLGVTCWSVADLIFDTVRLLFRCGARENVFHPGRGRWHSTGNRGWGYEWIPYMVDWHALPGARWCAKWYGAQVTKGSSRWRPHTIQIWQQGVWRGSD